jgi:[ribosomal protein S5]-alanine N-acetyltransferase
MQTNDKESYPMLATQRFKFRPFALSDIRELVRLASEHRVSDTSIGVPNPYTAEFARMWISSHPAEWRGRQALHWAATMGSSGGESQILGYVGLNRIDHVRHQGEVRFWVGSGTDRLGFAREWLEAIVDFAVAGLNLRRIYALQIARHPLAGRVLATIGMQQEGLARKRIYKEGLFEDVIVWSISDVKWQAMRNLEEEYFSWRPAADSPARPESKPDCR